MAEKKQVLAILERLRKAWPSSPKLEKETLDVYVSMLAELELEALKQAAVLLAKTWVPEYGRTFPSISEIRSAALEVSGARARIPAVGEAWAEARRLASTIGQYQRPRTEDFSHAIVLRAAMQVCGSWAAWCSDENMVATRARFFEIYGQLREREMTQQALPEAFRYLTAEESRQILEQLHADARQQRSLSPGTADEPLKHISELIRARPPVQAPEEKDERAGGGAPQSTPRRPSAPRTAGSAPRSSFLVGESMTDQEFRELKDRLLEKGKAG